MEPKANKNITPRSVDPSAWYLDIVQCAELAEYSPVKGCMVIKPNGYAIWEVVQKILDDKFKSLGVRNAYFPMLIPERLLKQEASHVEGFAPEVAVVTHAGNEKLDEPLVLRPTSETIIYETYKDWVHSYRDLPLLINQWANVIRWEKRTRPFLRTTEFLWQEGHTVHKNFEEADQFARQMLNVYQDFAENYMAIPIIAGIKSEGEKFAGALYTYTCESVMPDGKALQYATSHNLGDNFARAFDIKYLDENNNYEYAWQTSWGLSTRSIGALIMSHSDDKGLVLPPKMATTKVAILPIYNESSRDKVLAFACNLAEDLSNFNVFSNYNAVVVDESSSRIGEKHYKYEQIGIPLRIELGERDIDEGLAPVVRRDTGDKIKIDFNQMGESLAQLLEQIQNNLFNQAKLRIQDQVVEVNTWAEFEKAINENLLVMAHYDGTPETEKIIKDETGATVRCIPFDSKPVEGICIKTGQPSNRKVLFAKAY